MAEPKRLTTNDERELISLLRKDPVLAAKTLIMREGEGLKLAPHQRITLKDVWKRKPHNLWVFGRGVAKTFTSGLAATLIGTLIPSQRIGIISASYRQSQFVFDEIIRFYDESPYIQNSVSKPPGKNPTECSMIWKNKSFVKAIPIGDGKLLAVLFQSY